MGPARRDDISRCFAGAGRLHTWPLTPLHGQQRMPQRDDDAMPDEAYLFIRACEMAADAAFRLIALSRRMLIAGHDFTIRHGRFDKPAPRICGAARSRYDTP